jgi:rhodanese-related sulfurtransferase
VPKPLKLNAMALVDEARRHIQAIDAAEAMALHATGECLIVDVRDARERARDGFIPGSMHCPRGMVEFWIDPESPYFKPVFDTDKKILFHCAADFRAVLTTHTVTQMGVENAAHLKGGLKAWREAGGQIDQDSNDPEMRKP